MIKAASVLLILLAVSSAAFAAGDATSETCRCETCPQVIVALGPSSGSVSLNRTTKRQPSAFGWSPIVSERRWIYVIIHHSGTDGGSVEAIHNNHRQRKDAAGNSWLGIGYHFVIGNGEGMDDGNVESTFRWKQQIHGAHSGSKVHNANGIGICLIGNFQQQAPTNKQMAAVTELVGQLAQRYEIPARLVVGHNTVKPTACPGKFFPLQDVIRKSVLEGYPGG